MLKWKKLSEEEPKEEDTYLYFPTYINCGHGISTTTKAWLIGPYNHHRDIMYWAYIDKPPGYKEYESTRDEWED